MILPINISSLLSNRTIENSRIEYKEGWNPEDVAHTICAFANDIDNLGGGYIIIGVKEENGMPILPVTGLDKDSIDGINKKILGISKLIEPEYSPLAEHVTFDEKDLLVIWVPGGDLRPYKSPMHLTNDKTKRSGKAYYIRKLSNSVIANSDEEKHLFDISSREPFDDRINPIAKISDFRSNLISDYLGRIDSALYMPSLTTPLPELCVNMHIAKGPPEYLRPVNVGLMFFNERPDNFFRYARIEVVDKPDPTGEGMVEKIFYGPLDAQLQNAIRYIESYVVKEMVNKLPDRPEAERTFNYPFPAIEEALSNAVYHKDYQMPEPITVTITPDRMEILSIPGPDRSISDEDLANLQMVASVNRNRRIGDFLKELKLIEGRNTGIPLMIRALKNNGSDAPIFKTDQERTYFRVIIPVHKKFLNEPEKEKTIKIRKRKAKVELRSDIIAELEKKPLSVGELSRSLGYNRTSKTVSNVINTMIGEGIVEYEHPEKKNSRNQKVRIRQ